MFHKRNWLIILFMISLLVSCKNELTYSYLIKDPDILQQEVKRCELMDERVKQENKQCEIVLYAAANLISLMDEEREDPEMFGQEILKLQMKQAKLNKEINTLQDAADKSQIKDEQLKDLRKQYQGQQDEVDARLAVVAQASPES